MSMDELNTIISRAASDTTYRARFFEHFEAAVSAYEITPAERALLKRVTPDKFEAVFKKLEDWGQPPSAASMELMQLIFGPQLQDNEGSISKQWDLDRNAPTMRKLGAQARADRIGGIPTRWIMIFAGVALLGVILMTILLVALGASKNDSSGSDATGGSATPKIVATGGPTECPCVCLEECAEGAVTCITVCTDCNANRCVP